jgi:hypothetical protein
LSQEVNLHVPENVTFSEFASLRAHAVAPWILFATLGVIMDGKCIYCSDRSAGTPTLTVSWTPLPSSCWVFMRSFSFSCCQYLVLDVIPLFNVDCHRLRSGRVTEGLFPLRGLIPLCHLTLALDVSMSSGHTVIYLYG